MVRSERRSSALGYPPGMRALSSVLLLGCVCSLALGCHSPPNDVDAGMTDVPDAFAPLDQYAPDVFLLDDPGPAHAIFVLAPATPGTFFDLPWPNDLRVDAAGHPDLTGFPNPHSTLVDQYIAAVEAHQVGYSTNGAGYFRFSRHVDESSLPADAAASTGDASSVFLIDVDPHSATLGMHLPVVTEYQQLATFYWAERQLALRTPDGFPLESAHTYAFVITSRLHATDGTAFGRDADFETVIAGTAPANVMSVYQPALDALAPVMDDVIALAVFTTEDATGLAMHLRDYVRDTLPTPAITTAGYTLGTRTTHYEIITGHYGPVPIFQSGTIPYQTTGGGIDLDDGTIVEGNFDARFALTIPRGTMPAEGYPLVLYSHGTGGDYESFIEDHTADLLATLGYAVMGIDQIHHGERNPTMLLPDLLFFNLQNPDAVRYNTLESAVDIVSQARFAATMAIPMATLARDGAPIRFDTSRLWFFGHSQGGLVAPLYLAIDDATHGGVISEGGGLIGYALTQKTQPINIPQIVAGALGLHGIGPENFSLFHPLVSLLQGWIEPSEPTNYAPFLFHAPRTGFAPKSIFMTEGGMDPYTPPPAIEALAVAMRTPQIDPIWRRIPNEDLRGIALGGPTVTGNVAGGAATAGLLQFPNEGHFSVFDNTVCQQRYEGFFTSVATGTGPGTIPAAP